MNNRSRPVIDYYEGARQAAKKALFYGFFYGVIATCLFIIAVDYFK